MQVVIHAQAFLIDVLPQSTAQMHVTMSRILNNTSRPRPNPASQHKMPLRESGRSLRREDLLGVRLGDTVRKGEGEALGDKLLDVRSLDVLGLFQLDNSEDLNND
jgi:hypothetical protein